MQETKRRLRFNPRVRSPGGGHSNPLQYSCLENPTDRGAWWATVHKVAKCQTRLSDLAYTHAHEDYSLEDSLSGNWGNAPEKHRFSSSVSCQNKEHQTRQEHIPSGFHGKTHQGTSLVVCWLRLCDLNAGCPGSIPGQGTRPQCRS